MQLGVIIDPSPYLAELPRFLGQLPQGAAAFASDPAHYNFYSPQCVKDLTPGEFALTANRIVVAKLRFDPSPWKHESGLSLEYHDIKHWELSVDDDIPLGTNRLGSVILDEVLPNPAGCSHEITFTGGELKVICADIEARWK